MTSDRRLKPSDLSPDQREVFEEITSWSTGNSVSRDHSLLRIGGLAGSGKSTLIGVLASTWNLQVAFCAFTGRASSILERKLRACGVKTTSAPYMDAAKMGRSKLAHLFSSDLSASYCGTIHRLLYRPVINGRDELIGFAKRTELDRPYDLIVCDESSMIGDEMLLDLKSHGVPILAIGDHGQLPPVQASGSLMQNPDLRLEKIHRQIQGSPIIQLAHHIRNGGTFRSYKGPFK